MDTLIKFSVCRNVLNIYTLGTTCRTFMIRVKITRPKNKQDASVSRVRLSFVTALQHALSISPVPHSMRVQDSLSMLPETNSHRFHHGVLRVSRGCCITQMLLRKFRVCLSQKILSVLVTSKHEILSHTIRPVCRGGRTCVMAL